MNEPKNDIEKVSKNEDQAFPFCVKPYISVNLEEWIDNENKKLQFAGIVRIEELLTYIKIEES